MEDDKLTRYINASIGHIVADVLKHTLFHLRETRFLTAFRRHSEQAMAKRERFELEGHHIPAYLIASITHSCNLFCKGCYARTTGMCAEKNDRALLTAGQWSDIFSQAEELGVSFILLAGGEPPMRKDVIQKASSFQSLVFPVFTNGTLIDETWTRLFDKHRNLLPIISLEGQKDATDERRGKGVYQKLLTKMKLLKRQSVLFGVSITVTTENLYEVTDAEFVKGLKRQGCRVILFIEYVPVGPVVQPSGRFRRRAEPHGAKHRRFAERHPVGFVFILSRR